MSTLPPEIAVFDHAQRMTIDLMRAVVDNLETGMSERDVHDLAIEQAPAFGFSGWFAKPEVRFDGARSIFHRPSIGFGRPDGWVRCYDRMFDEVSVGHCAWGGAFGNGIARTHVMAERVVASAAQQRLISCLHSVALFERSLRPLSLGHPPSEYLTESSARSGARVPP